jgi:hypothetical protein
MEGRPISEDGMLPELGKLYERTGCTRPGYVTALSELADDQSSEG